MVHQRRPVAEQIAAGLQAVCGLVMAQAPAQAPAAAPVAARPVLGRECLETRVRESVCRTGRLAIRVLDTPDPAAGWISEWLAHCPPFQQPSASWRVLSVTEWHGGHLVPASSPWPRVPGQAESARLALASASAIPPSLAIVNEEVAVLSSLRTGGQPVIVGFLPAVAAMVPLFDALWMSARACAQPALDRPPSHLAGILEQLASGTLDQTAQRNLRMSSRTFNRRSAELLRALNATSRFQAGLMAGRRDWI